MNIKDIKSWFETAIPTPTIEQAAIQVGCHAEEFSEMAKTIRMQGETPEDIANDFKRYPELMASNVVNCDKVQMLDDLCDQIVTAIGVAHMLGMDIEGALAEVNDSNHSKFEDGKAVFDDNGKITKGKNYRPPSLESFI